MNFVGSEKLGLKYERFTPSFCKDIRMSYFEFVAKTQFLYMMLKLFKNVELRDKSRKIVTVERDTEV